MNPENRFHITVRATLRSDGQSSVYDFAITNPLQNAGDDCLDYYCLVYVPEFGDKGTVVYGVNQQQAIDLSLLYVYKTLQKLILDHGAGSAIEFVVAGQVDGGVR